MKWKFEEGQKVTTNVTWISFPYGTKPMKDEGWVFTVFKQGIARKNKNSKDTGIYYVKDEQGKLFYFLENELEVT